MLDEDRTASDVIDAYAEELLEAMLAGWYQDESGWPADRTPHQFRQFFDIEVIDAVHDVDEDLPLADDPDAEDFDEDQEDELDGDDEASRQELRAIASSSAAAPGASETSPSTARASPWSSPGSTNPVRTRRTCSCPSTCPAPAAP